MKLPSRVVFKLKQLSKARFFFFLYLHHYYFLYNYFVVAYINRIIIGKINFYLKNKANMQYNDQYWPEI